MDSKIRCEICGKQFKSLVPHLKLHKVTATKYKKKYDVIRLTSDKTSIKVTNMLKGRKLSNTHKQRIVDTHWSKNKKLRNETIKKCSKKLKQNYIDDPTLSKRCTKKAHKKVREHVKKGTWILQRENRNFKQWTHDKTSEVYKRASKKLSAHAKNGGASWACSHVKTVSKPQKILYEKVKTIFPNAILEHPVKVSNRSFRLDIFIPMYNVAIEYDGSYWHDKKADASRDKYLKSIGIKTIHYVDYIPTEVEIREDIKKINIIPITIYKI